MLQILANEGIMPYAFLLSSYDEFSFAKQGFNLGVLDYILKNEITSDLILNKLRKARKLVLANRKNNLAILHKDLKHLMTDDFEVSKEFRNKEFRYMLICADPPLPINNMVPHQINLMPLLDDLSSSSDLQDKFLAFDIILPYVIIVVLANSLCPNKSIYIALTERIKSIWNKHLDCHNSIFLIDTPLLLIELHKLLQDKAISFSSNYFLPEKPWYQLTELNIIPSPSFSLSEHRSSIISAVDTKDLKGLHLSLKSAYKMIIENANYEMLVTFTNEMIQLIKEYQNQLPENQCSQITDNFYFFRANDIPDRIILCFNKLFQISNHTYSPIVNHAIHYIYTHFSEQDLSAAKIAEAVHVSTNYLHKLFKDETGDTINTFVTDLRVKQSMQLLTGTSLKTSEIANRVGFISSKYYAKVFFKHAGQNVSDYRKGFKK